MLKIERAKHMTTTAKFEDGKVIISRSQDVAPNIEDVKALRDQGLVGSSDMRHVARIPSIVLEAECERLGVRLDDRDAVREVIFNKIQSGDWAKFSVHSGGY